jgi:hypothetical protein
VKAKLLQQAIPGDELAIDAAVLAEVYEAFDAN